MAAGSNISSKSERAIEAKLDWSLTCGDLFYSMITIYVPPLTFEQDATSEVKPQIS